MKRSCRSALDLPRDPGERDGRKEESLGSADLGVGRDEVLFGLEDVGTPFKQLRREAGGDGGRGKCRERVAPRDGPGVAAEQDAERLLRLSNLVLDLRDRRGGGFVLRAGLLDRHLRSLAVLETQFEEFDRIVIGFEGALGNHQLLVQTAELDVGRGDLRNQREDHAATRLLCCEHAGTGRFREPAYAAPEVDFPTGAGKDLEVLLGIGHQGGQGGGVVLRQALA